MITREQHEKERRTSLPRLKVVANGPFGSGKTYFAMTFPKFAYAWIEPNGLVTMETEGKLRDNMVCYEPLVLQRDEKQVIDSRGYFKKLTEFLMQVRIMALKEEVETFILDNATYLLENRWIFINQHQLLKSKSGEINTLGMYGELARWAYRFFLVDIMSLPCHVVVTVHEMEETEEHDGKRTKTGRTISNLLGGFRDKIGGLCNLYTFLDCIKRDGKYEYRARCRPGAGKAAKNNLGLPEMVNDISYGNLVAKLKPKGE